MEHIRKIVSESAGPGEILERIYLKNGYVLSISEESLYIYEDQNRIDDVDFVPLEIFEFIRRKFICYWGYDYINSDNEMKPKVHDESFFSLSNGYSEFDIENVLALKRFEVTDLSNDNVTHIVMRVE